MAHRDDFYVNYKKNKNNVLDAHHIAKRKLANRDLHVSFDPKDHKEFLTGFRKRKQQRRLDAQQQIKKKEKQVKSDERAKRKAELREKLGLGDNFGVESSSDDDRPVKMKPSSVKVYEGPEYTTVATIEEIHNSSSDEEVDSEDPVSDEKGSGKVRQGNAGKGGRGSLPKGGKKAGGKKPGNGNALRAKKQPMKKKANKKFSK